MLTLILLASLFAATAEDSTDSGGDGVLYDPPQALPDGGWLYELVDDWAVTVAPTSVGARTVRVVVIDQNSVRVYEGPACDRVPSDAHGRPRFWDGELTYQCVVGAHASAVSWNPSRGSRQLSRPTPDDSPESGREPRTVPSP